MMTRIGSHAGLQFERIGSHAGLQFERIGLDHEKIGLIE